MKARTVGTGLVVTLATLAGFAGSGHAQVGNNGAVLNPNLAGEGEMMALPQLDAESVEAIVKGRPYLRLSEFHAVVSAHVAGDDVEALYDKLFLPINLNDVTEAEILMVPGVGNRMAHEFEEYRPYRGLAEFRREMGKYVDDDEVRRLEQFVFVPIDLNTAADEAILSIPGVGNRLLREFKEYRPYRAIAEFRREIGKYVDDDEMARLERYVVIN